MEVSTSFYHFYYFKSNSGRFVEAFLICTEEICPETGQVSEIFVLFL